MSCVEVHHYEAIWIQRFDMTRWQSALNALQMFGGKSLSKLRILKVDSGSETDYV